MSPIGIALALFAAFLLGVRVGFSLARAWGDSGRKSDRRRS